MAKKPAFLRTDKVPGTSPTKKLPVKAGPKPPQPKGSKMPFMKKGGMAKKGSC